LVCVNAGPTKVARVCITVFHCSTFLMQGHDDMSSLEDLFKNNRSWVARMTAEDPKFFSRLASQQTPRYLWIGCSDSRVPANQIVGWPPVAVVVHRNVRNLVLPSDLNCLSVLQYAVEVLKVAHIMVVGHYG